MTKSDYPRLCGGTFMTLLLLDLKQRIGVRQHYRGESDGLSDQDVLIGLMTVIKPEYERPGKKDSFKGKANKYKSCQIAKGDYLIFDNVITMNAFDQRVKNNYQMALNDMIDFVERFLETGASDQKELYLARALADLIKQDEGISAEQEFYIGEHGEPVRKEDISKIGEICLPSFLLGVWHYAALQDNTIGRDTYDCWCPSNNGGRRDYSGDMGIGLTYPQRVYTIDKVIEEFDDDTDEDVFEGVPDPEEPEKDDAEQGAAGNNAPPNQQIMNNSQSIFVQQTGDGNIVMPNYGEITINFNR